MSVSSFIDDGKNFLQKYAGTASYTLGANTTFTGGISNQIVAGAAMTATLGGQVAFTYPLNATFAMGTYLEAVSGNNVVWSNGSSLNVATGESVTFSEDNTQQVQNSLQLKAGLSPADVFIDGAITGFLESAALAIRVLMGINVAITALGAGADIAAQQTEDEASNFTRNATLVGTTLAAGATSGIASAIASRKLATLISKLADAYKTLTHVSTLNLSQTSCILQRKLVGITSKLDMSDVELTLSRAMAVTQQASTLAMNPAQTTLSHKLSEAYTQLQLNEATATISASAGPSLSVSQERIKAATGEGATTLTMYPAEILLMTKTPAGYTGVDVGAGTVALSAQGESGVSGLMVSGEAVSMTSAESVLTMGTTGFSVAAPNIRLG
jgi:hypothetical protein